MHGTGLDACPTWSNIQDWNCSFCTAGEEGCGFTYHNICADPEFVDADGPDDMLGNADDDLRLTKWSPSIEKGNDNLIPVDFGDVDFDGNNSEILPWDIATNTRDKDAGFDPGTNFDVDQGAYEYQCPACPWDLDHNGTVGTNDLLILIAQWGKRCHAADLVLPDTVGTTDQLALLAHWGTCAPCFGGEGAGAAWDPQLVAAVQVVGFTGQADYTDWALHVAIDGQVHAATVVLAAILDE